MKHDRMTVADAIIRPTSACGDANGASSRSTRGSIGPASNEEDQRSEPDVGREAVVPARRAAAASTDAVREEERRPRERARGGGAPSLALLLPVRDGEAFVRADVHERERREKRRERRGIAQRVPRRGGREPLLPRAREERERVQAALQRPADHRSARDGREEPRQRARGVRRLVLGLDLILDRGRAEHARPRASADIEPRGAVLRVARAARVVVVAAGDFAQARRARDGRHRAGRSADRRRFPFVRRQDVQGARARLKIFNGRTNSRGDRRRRARDE
eukprot:31499-Pelagococcus_subviridis.AAC.51